MSRPSLILRPATHSQRLTGPVDAAMNLISSNTNFIDNFRAWKSSSIFCCWSSKRPICSLSRPWILEISCLDVYRGFTYCLVTLRSLEPLYDTLLALQFTASIAALTHLSTFSSYLLADLGILCSFFLMIHTPKVLDYWYWSFSGPYKMAVAHHTKSGYYTTNYRAGERLQWLRLFESTARPRSQGPFIGWPSILFVVPNSETAKLTTTMVPRIYKMCRC